MVKKRVTLRITRMCATAVYRQLSSALVCTCALLFCFESLMQSSSMWVGFNLIKL
jgi:hypothetical protein